MEPPPSTSQCWLRAGDVLFNNTNSEDLVGKTAYWSLDGQYTLSNHMTLIRSLAPETVDTYWLFRCTICGRPNTSRAVSPLCRASKHQPGGSCGVCGFRCLQFPEQRAIAHILRAVQAAREAPAARGQPGAGAQGRAHGAPVHPRHPRRADEADADWGSPGELGGWQRLGEIVEFFRGVRRSHASSVHEKHEAFRFSRHRHHR